MEDSQEELKMQNVEYTIVKEEGLPALEAFLKQESIDQAFKKPLSQRPQSIKERVKEKFEKGRWLLAKDESGSIVGCLALIPREKEIEISTFAVSPETKGHGIGTELIRRAEDETRRSYPEYGILILDSWEDNKPIERIMEKTGFQFRESFLDPDKRPEGIKTVIYEKNLAS